MTVTIDLPPETEAKLRAQASAQGTNLENYLGELAQRWAEETAQHSYDNEKTPEQRVADWLEFVNSHEHITAVADDSRESIYEGRGD